MDFLHLFLPYPTLSENYHCVLIENTNRSNRSSLLKKNAKSCSPSPWCSLLFCSITLSCETQRMFWWSPLPKVEPRSFHLSRLTSTCPPPLGSQESTLLWQTRWSKRMSSPLVFGPFWHSFLSLQWSSTQTVPSCTRMPSVTCFLRSCQLGFRLPWQSFATGPSPSFTSWPKCGEVLLHLSCFGDLPMRWPPSTKPKSTVSSNIFD